MIVGNTCLFYGIAVVSLGLELKSLGETNDSGCFLIWDGEIACVKI